MAIADGTYYLNADRSKAMPAKSAKAGQDETPEGAAFLLVREGGQISDEDAEKYGVKTRKAEEAPTEEPNIVISGGTNTGPARVTGEPLEGQQEGQTGETRVDAPARTTEKADSERKRSNRR